MKVFSLKNSLLTLGLLLCSHSLLAKDTVTIYAASSMTNAVTEIVEAFKKQQNINVVTVFGGSSSLARQIDNGAPADVFLSANEKWVNYLIDKKIVADENVELLAGNQLVLIKPKAGTQKAFDLSSSDEWQKQLANNRMAIGNIDAVPVGIYAKEALVNLGVWETVKPYLAQTNNVRHALALVERGESPLGIVYKTDALLTNNVEVLVSFDPSLHGVIHYPLVRLTDKNASKQLIKFMSSDTAKVVLDRYGFRTDMEKEQFAQ